MHGVGAELAREIAVGRVGLGDHEDPTRALVEAMNESRPGASPSARPPGLGAFAVTDVVHEGDVIDVKVLEVDKSGKIRLSRKEALKEGQEASQ